MSSANQAQFDQWNAASQARTWPKRERVTSGITPDLLKALALRPGERIVDIGSGGGLAAMEAAKAVGPGGAVVGFDISAPLTALAKQRAAEANCANVQFVAGDAQTEAIPGAPFDAAMSQFGVMFFSDPIAAFKNIRGHLRDGGRLAFVCWQPYDKNKWFPGPVLSPYQPPPPPTEHGGPPPGPFALGDEEYVRGILDGAGFTGVHIEPFERDVAIPDDSLVDRELVDGLRVDDATKEKAWADLQAFRETLKGPDGMLHFRIAPQIVRASA